MALTAFDTLKFANTLKAAGVPDRQAEAEATVISEAFSTNLKELTTKEYLDQRLGVLTAELKARDDTMEAKHRGELALIRWMLGATMSFCLAILAIVARLAFFSSK